LISNLAGFGKIPTFKVLLGQSQKIVHVFRFELNSLAQGSFRLPVFPQVKTEQPEVIVYSRSIGEAPDRQLQVDFSLGVLFFLCQQQPQRILNVVQIRIGLDDLGQERFSFCVSA
jgi:hypothetical protein